MRAAGAAALALALLPGCASSGAAGAPPKASPDVPPPDAPLIELAPAGAELVVELDVARLRHSEALGELAEALADELPAGDVAGQLLATEAIALASYHLGKDEAQALTLLRGDAAGAIEGARALAGDVWALGPDALVDLAAKTAKGEVESASSSQRLAELRGAARPGGAPGSALLVTGDLGFGARVELSRLLSLADVPVAVSMWGDVVDDLAVIALLGAATEDEAAALADAADAWRARASAWRPLARYGLGPAIRGAEVTVEGATVRITLVVSPARLSRAAEALARDVSVASKEQP